MAPNRVSASVALTFSKDGSTTSGGILVIGNPNQQVDKNTGVYEPDYTVAANQPIWYPNITNSVVGGVITGMSNFRNVNVFWNNIKIVSNGVVQSGYAPDWEYTTYGNCPALKRKSNITLSDGSYELRFEFEVNIGTHWEKVVASNQASLTIISSVAYQVYLEPNNGGVVDANAASPNCILTPRVTLGTAQITSGIYFKYYKLVNGAWTGSTTGVPSLTISPANVDGIDTFKVDVHKTNASGAILCSDVQQVIDNSDPFRFEVPINDFLPHGPAQTISPKVMQGESDKTALFRFTDIRLISSKGVLIKLGSTANKNITITYDDGKDDPGQPLLVIEAELI